MILYTLKYEVVKKFIGKDLVPRIDQNSVKIPLLQTHLLFTLDTNINIVFGTADCLYWKQTTILGLGV